MSISHNIVILVLTLLFVVLYATPIQNTQSSTTDRHWRSFSRAGQSNRLPRASSISDVIRQQTDGRIKDTPAPSSVVKRLANLIIVTKRGDNRVQARCTATVIEKDWLLSSAVCFASFGRSVSLEESYAFVGEANATLTIENTDIKPFRFKKVLIHKDFNPSGFSPNNDIALVQLDRSIDASRFAKVSLSQSNSSDPSPMNTILAAGYGLIANPGSSNNERIFAEVAMEVPLKTESFETCIARTAPNQVPEEDGIICAVPSESEAGLRDICSGDSGGPLYENKSDNEPVFQFGIVSYSTTFLCAQPDTINYNTRISHFYTNITQALSNNFDSWNVAFA